MRKVKIKSAFDCTLPGEDVARMHYKNEELELDDEVAASCVKSGAGVYLEGEAPAPSPEPEAAADPSPSE